MRITHFAAALFAGVLAACASGPAPYSDARYGDAGYYPAEFGRVVDIQNLGTVPGDSGTTGAGAVVGGVLGGVLGHQIGGGRGKDAATVAGAIGGAVVGNEVERSRRSAGVDEYRIAVRLDRGGTRTVVQGGLGDVRVGDRVRIENGRVFRG